MTTTTLAEWDAHYTAGDGWRPVIDEETRLFHHHLGDGAGQLALDVACGTGGYVAALHQLGWDASGIDYSPTAIHQARRQYPDLTFTVGDIEQDLPPGRYALITFRLAWAFMADTAALLDRLHQHLAPGGALHITTPVAERLPDDRRDIGITAEHVQQFHATHWADVTEYDLDTLACYTLRRH